MPPASRSLLPTVLTHLTALIRRTGLHLPPACWYFGAFTALLLYFGEKDVTPSLNWTCGAFWILFRAHILKLRCSSCGTVKADVPSWEITVSFQERQNQMYPEVIRRPGILIFRLLLIINSKSPNAGYEEVAPAKTVPNGGLLSLLPCVVQQRWLPEWPLPGVGASLACAARPAAALPASHSVFPSSLRIGSLCLSSPLMRLAFIPSLSSSGSFIHGCLAHYHLVINRCLN